MKKTIFAVVIMSTITLVAGCGQQKTNQEKSNNQSSSQGTETSTKLKTYTNKKYSFEFQYPETWTLNENNSKITPKSPKNCGPNITGESKEPTCLDSVSFGVVNNGEKLSISDYWKKEYGWEKEQQYKNLKKQKNGNVATFSATTISGYDGIENYTFWVTLSDGNFFALTSSYLADDQKKVFDNMVSSFRFTK